MEFITPLQKQRNSRKRSRLRRRNRLTQKYTRSGIVSHSRLSSRKLFKIISINDIMLDANYYFTHCVPNNQAQHPYGYMGVCGISQSSIYCACLKHKIAPKNIKLFNIATFVTSGGRHAFVMVKIDNDWYLCDLSFKQFIYNQDEVEQLSSNMRKLYDNHYIILPSDNMSKTTERLKEFFRYATRNVISYEQTEIPATLEYAGNINDANLFTTMIKTPSDILDNSCPSIMISHSQSSP